MRFRVRYLGMFVLMLAVLAVASRLVMALWNAVMPGIFPGAHLIDYPHAAGLLVLSRLLFGGFRGRGGWRRHRDWHRFEGMSGEERERFRSTMRARGCGPREGTA
jgi:hypothetical protein